MKITLNGRAMFSRSMTNLPLALTTKHPLRGFSAFIVTFTPGFAFFTADSIFAADG
jgi:hypothetical protein